MKEKYDEKTEVPFTCTPEYDRSSCGPVKISPGKKNPALLMREPTATEHTHTKRVRTSSGMMSVLFLLSLQSSSKFLFPEIHPVLQGMIMPVSAGSL